MSDAHVQISLPPQTRFVALARVTAVSLGAELDFDVDALEELRMASNEVAALMLERAEDAGANAVHMAFTLRSEGEVELVVSIDEGTAESPPEPDPLAEQILAAVTDEFEIRSSWARVLKRRA